MNDERRNSHRRDSDIEGVSEVRLLRHEINSLEEKLQAFRTEISKEERADQRRLEALEAEVNEFKRKFNVGKGIFYGCIAGLGAGGVLVLDRLTAIIKSVGIIE